MGFTHRGLRLRNNRSNEKNSGSLFHDSGFSWNDNYSGSEGVKYRSIPSFDGPDTLLRQQANIGTVGGEKSGKPVGFTVTSRSESRLQGDDTVTSKDRPTTGRVFTGPKASKRERLDLAKGRAKAEASSMAAKEDPTTSLGSRPARPRPKSTGKAGVRRTRSTDF